MIRLLCLRAALLLAIAILPAPALADVGPKMAYSTQTEVYLVNPGGGGKVRLYRSRSNNFISSVSLRPTGGQIAFVEDWAVKFLDFDALGRPIGPVRTIAPSCFRLANVRYHPDGNSVLFHELCGDSTEIKRSAVPSASNPKPAAAVLLAENSSEVYLYESAWEPGGNSIVYSLSNAVTHELRRRSLDGGDSLILARANRQIRYADVSPDGTKILISDYGLGTTLGVGHTAEIDSQTGAAVRPDFKGQHARYEPGGSRIVFIDYRTYNERYLRLLNADGTPGQVGGKGVYWSVDWRP